MRKIRKGDTVQVIAGKDKGRQGKVLRVVSAEAGARVVVEGVNLHKHHDKARGQDQPAGIHTREAPLDISNVALLSPTTGKPVRVGFKVVVDGAGAERKVRTVHKTGEVIDPV